jgi:hypothetical protein
MYPKVEMLLKWDKAPEDVQDSAKPALQRPGCFLLLVPSPTKWGLPVMFRGLAARR